MMAARGLGDLGQHVLVCGLGATGQSLLRFFAAHESFRVTAWDSRRTPPNQEAIAARFPGVTFVCGEAQSPDVLLADIHWLAVSPGIPLDHPLFECARRKGLKLVGDIELFARVAGRPIVGVTGSNGKSTVVTALSRMAKGCGLNAPAGGNLAPPALDILDPAADCYLLELSSFQLELCEHLPLKVGAVLNISPDHLDRHGDLQSYTAAKGRVFADAEVAVQSADDSRVRALPASGRVVRFGTAADATYRVHQGSILVGHEPICSTAQLKLVGSHNHLNAAAALAISDAMAWDRAPALQALAEFQGLPHRCEWVATKKGVTWINDSKGTNVGALEAAVAGLSGPLVVLVGGQAKGGDFAPLVPVLQSKARRIILFGQDALRIRQQLQGLEGVELVETLADAIRHASDVAESGDAVLLSPGCASFDQFRGYEDRGEQFRKHVLALPDGDGA